MAQSKMIHQTGRTRFAKLSLAILEKLTPLLQDILLKEISPNQIYFEVSNDQSLCKKLRGEQILLIQNAQKVGYIDFDITLLYTLLRNLKCLKVTAPTQGWGTSQMPGNSETTLGDDIERIRLIRNKVVAHTAAPSLSKSESKTHWSEIAGIGKRMENWLGKKYLLTLMQSELCTIDTKMESIYLEKIKELVDAEKSTKELLQKVIKGDKALYVEETVKIDTKNPRKRKFCEALTESSISILNELKNSITEQTLDSEIKQIYESIEEFIRSNKEDMSQISWSQYFQELEQKVKNNGQLKLTTIQTLARHLRFILRLNTLYRADIESSKAKLQLKFVFSSKRGYDLFMQDFQSGEIEKLTQDVFHHPPYLANFDLHTEDLTVQLIDDTGVNNQSNETVLSERDVSKFNRVIGKDMDVIANYLELSQVEIERFKMENPTSMNAVVHKILLTWKRKLGNAATLEKLEKSLQEVEQDTGASVDWKVFSEAKKDILKKKK